ECRPGSGRRAFYRLRRGPRRGRRERRGRRRWFLRVFLTKWCLSGHQHPVRISTGEIAGAGESGEGGKGHIRSPYEESSTRNPYRICRGERKRSTTQGAQ